MKTLVIRSASLERMDCLMERLDANPDILTHPGAVAGISANYPSCNVIEYPFRSNFNKKDAARLIRGGKIRENYDEVIVLASNLGGGGHHNVLETAFLFGGKVRLFNTNSQFADISLKSVKTEKIKRVVMLPLVIFGTILLTVWGLFVLLKGFVKNRSGIITNNAMSRYGD